MKIGIDARMLGPKQGGIGRYIHELIKALKHENTDANFVISTEAKQSGEIPSETPEGSLDFARDDKNEGCHITTNQDSSVSSLPQNDKKNDWIPDRVGNDKTNFEFVIFLRKENWDLVDETPNVKKILADIHWYGWREQLLLPGIIKKEKVDLMHFPHWNIPLFYRKPFVVTIHDLLLLHYPTRSASTLGPITYFFKNLAYKIILRHAIKNSRHILAPSEYTKNDILKNFFTVKPEKITVTHLAPMPMDSRFRGNDTPEILHPPQNDKNNTHPHRLATEGRRDSSTRPSASVGMTTKITKPYVLYVGVAYPHKNLGGLIQAWEIFCAEHGKNYQLVLAGRKNYFYDKLDSRLRGNDSVMLTGYIPDEDLPALYRGALLYVFPSFYEGFGLPPLEAMQYGVPVASSNATCLPEVLGQAASYFDPHNPQDMADTIWRALTDQNLRESLNKNGVQLIHNYSWNKVAQATTAVYRDVL